MLSVSESAEHTREGEAERTFLSGEQESSSLSCEQEKPQDCSTSESWEIPPEKSDEIFSPEVLMGQEGMEQPIDGNNTLREDGSIRGDLAEMDETGLEDALVAGDECSVFVAEEGVQREGKDSTVVRDSVVEIIVTSR